ncbi:hypothetical protein DL96DRAFT_1454607 [Flagelloscypha sp. PMI_526]|nr:hypothetical protein DL96DRAFT_1454607 [Flagelloscypha sp. PMI_526]
MPSAFTTISQATATTGRPTLASQGASSQTPTPFAISGATACVGNGLDASADGILASVLVPSALGLLIWLLFAILRPHFRQVYALREWFPPQDTRPERLSSSFWAFLFPHVPLVPAVPTDVTDAGQSAEKDAELFPGDEQLTQRTVWTAFLIVLAFTVVALAGALPLYMVSVPCQSELGPDVFYGGASSMMHDMSLLRLLRHIDANNISTTNLFVSPSRSLVRRAFDDDSQHSRTRIIVLTVLAAVLILLPAMRKIIKEFNVLVQYRKSWLQTKCANLEMGWIGVNTAPGFVGWGEQELKDFIISNGLGTSLRGGSNNRSRSRSSGRKHEHSDEQSLTSHPEENTVIDIHSLYTIASTDKLSVLIEERDEILENLEVAETQYISSFRITTPDPSIADPLEFPQSDDARPYISRPRPLGARVKHHRLGNPALATSSSPPTAFVAPSQFYRLHNTRGVTGGRFMSSQPSFTASVDSRTPGGSRFREIERHDEVPLGTAVEYDEHGVLAPADSQQQLWVPDPRRFGPNYSVPEADEGNEPGWVDVSGEAEHGRIASENNGAPSSFRRPPKGQAFTAQRETFPFRGESEGSEATPAPPHLRLQPSQPFVRPVEGVDFDQLGAVYGSITHWRSKLKAINMAIADAQNIGYSDIAEGQGVKGWLLVGTNIRFLPGIELIEGRAKEDVQYGVLQTKRSSMDGVVFWIICATVSLLLAIGLTAVAGLALANAPEVAHYLPFLQPLWNQPPIVTGIATVFAPSIAGVIFIMLALSILSWAVKQRGTISISGSQVLLFRATFWVLTGVGAIWLIAVGALIYSIRPFDIGTNAASDVANGSIYMAVIALALVLNVAIILPGLLLLQPLRLWRVTRAQKRSITPRQRFRAIYPRSYNPTYAIGACVLALVFASTFALIFPLVAPAVMILLFLSLLAHRFLVGYVYGRTHSQTGGIVSIYLIRRLGTLAGFEPILMGLIFLSRHIWIEGGVLVGAGVFTIIGMEIYAWSKLRLPGRSALSETSRNGLKAFTASARTPEPVVSMIKSESGTSSPRPQRTRGSMASVLEMMSITLAVMPSSGANRDPVPLATETIDDLTATERAARTNPNAPPRLPPLPFAREDLSAILYAPELLALDPKIWLPNDSAGVARAEAIDLQRYHGLDVVLDVQSTRDVSTPARRSTSSE